MLLFRPLQVRKQILLLEKCNEHQVDAETIEAVLFCTLFFVPELKDNRKPMKPMVKQRILQQQLGMVDFRQFVYHDVNLYFKFGVGDAQNIAWPNKERFIWNKFEPDIFILIFLQQNILYSV